MIDRSVYETFFVVDGVRYQWTPTEVLPQEVITVEDLTRHVGQPVISVFIVVGTREFSVRAAQRLNLNGSTYRLIVQPEESNQGDELMQGASQGLSGGSVVGNANESVMSTGTEDQTKRSRRVVSTNRMTDVLPDNLRVRPIDSSADFSSSRLGGSSFGASESRKRKGDSTKENADLRKSKKSKNRDAGVDEIPRFRHMPANRRPNLSLARYLEWSKLEDENAAIAVPACPASTIGRECVHRNGNSAPAEHWRRHSAQVGENWYHIGAGLELLVIGRLKKYAYLRLDEVTRAFGEGLESLLRYLSTIGHVVLETPEASQPRIASGVAVENPNLRPFNVRTNVEERRIEPIPDTAPEAADGEQENQLRQMRRRQ
ncbi:hypothetical protein M3Y97_00838500 [Aphelenchoides bicaudatus]|nr:hypothetical protein M3Y97_00838500 [Aphelenchoides bicaudatus]